MLTPGALITPAAQTPFGQEAQIRAALGSQLIAAVQKVGGNLQGTLIYRDLTANDLQSGATRLQNANSTGLTASAFTTIFSGSAGFSLPVNQAIGIYGFISYDANPLIDVLKFFLGASGTPLAIINVAQIYTDNRITKGLWQPLIWKPQEVLDVQAKTNSNVAQNGANFQLLGVIAEPVGLNITPRSDLDNLVPAGA